MAELRTVVRRLTHGLPELPTDPEASGWRVTVPDCPTCGATITEMRQDNDFQPIYPVDEMWPGGPLVSRTDLLPERMLCTSSTITVGCGHVWPTGKTLTIRYDPPSRLRRAIIAMRRKTRG